MLGLLKSLKNVSVRRKRGQLALEWQLAALHHRLTVIFLVICIALACSRQYFGEPIQCMQDRQRGSNIATKVLNTFCFVTSTYTVVDGNLRDAVSGFPGVSPDGGATSVRRHAYYQWVPLVLLLQSFLFALPRAFWHYWEGGRVANLLHGFVPGTIYRIQGENRMLPIANYISATLNSYHWWVLGFILAECLYLVNIFGNLLLTDALVDGRFLELGVRVIRFVQGMNQTSHGLFSSDWSSSSGSRSNPLDIAFPKLTKCTFRKYGASGTIERRDALCVMTLNVLNEKIFTALWFWFVFLTIVTSIAFLWRIITAMLLIGAKKYPRSCLVIWAQWALGLPIAYRASKFGRISCRLNIGDWIFLYVIGRNITTIMYKELIEELNEIIIESNSKKKNLNNKNKRLRS